jgi:hypothetical protein
VQGPQTPFAVQIEPVLTPSQNADMVHDEGTSHVPLFAQS